MICMDNGNYKIAINKCKAALCKRNKLWMNVRRFSTIKPKNLIDWLTIWPCRNKQLGLVSWLLLPAWWASYSLCPSKNLKHHSDHCFVLITKLTQSNFKNVEGKNILKKGGGVVRRGEPWWSLGNNFPLTFVQHPSNLLYQIIAQMHVPLRMIGAQRIMCELRVQATALQPSVVHWF